MVVERFSGVENKSVEIKEWTEHPYGVEEVGVRGHIVPVKVRKLSDHGNDSESCVFWFPRV